MNPAARTAFALPLDEFSKAIPLGVKRRFARCVDEQAGVLFSIKIGRAPAFRCSVEILKLAGGEEGLIVAETPADLVLAPTPPAPPPFTKKQAASKAKSKKSASFAKPASAPVLSVDEMRAFKAIGRKVRRLCEEKRAESEKKAAAARLRARPRPELPAEQADQVWRALFAAFDLVLWLDGGLEVVRVEGRPRMGWRKASLIGQPVSELLPSPERTRFQRMLEKLHSGAGSVRDTLCVLDGKGRGSQCRAVLGRGHAAEATLIFAVLSLELPARRLREQAPRPGAAPARLAA